MRVPFDAAQRDERVVHGAAVARGAARQVVAGVQRPQHAACEAQRQARRVLHFDPFRVCWPTSAATVATRSSSK
ncbi:MAG: hypothetical protein ACRDI2_01695 [Chloroflexota bacterium]